MEPEQTIPFNGDDWKEKLIGQLEGGSRRSWEAEVVLQLEKNSKE